MMLPNHAFQRTRKGQRAAERWRWAAIELHNTVNQKEN